MATERTRLAVILHADVVGSTELVHTDERLAHQRIRGAFARFAATITAYRGVAHEVRGDALVAEFERASDAVSAALAFQSANQALNDTLPDDLRPEVRVGISMGEIVVADGTLTGPDVVLAQRIEQLADPGQVCISSAVQQSVPRRLPFDYIDIGERDLKGFRDPVRCFSVELLAGETLPEPEGGVAKPRARVAALAVAGLVVLSVIAAATFYALSRQDPTPAASVEVAPGPALPDKPSIAVLPFRNLSDDIGQEYFAEGIAEDLITDLSKIRGIFVIARDSSFAYKGKNVVATEIARKLGVHFILQGSVRPSGDNLRVSAQLTNGQTGQAQWGERFDGRRDNALALEEKVLGEVIRAIKGELSPAELELVEHRGTDNAEAHDLLLRARRFLASNDRAARKEGQDALKRAIELDPKFAAAYALLAETRLPSSQRRAVALRSIDLGRSTAGYTALADDYLLKGDPGRAAQALRKGIELEPNNADAQQLMARAMMYLGDVEAAYRHIRAAIRLNPALPDAYRSVLGRVHFAASRYEDAVVELEEVISRKPTWRVARAYLAAAYAHLGDLDTAAQYGADLRPSSTLSVREPYQDALLLAQLVEGVKLARGEE